MVARGVFLTPESVSQGVGRRPLSPQLVGAGGVLALAGIFVMRFAFYLMHMTVGLGL